jgi:hypothetical protein
MSYLRLRIFVFENWAVVERFFSHQFVDGFCDLESSLEDDVHVLELAHDLDAQQRVRRRKGEDGFVGFRFVRKTDDGVVGVLETCLK